MTQPTQTDNPLVAFEAAVRSALTGWRDTVTGIRREVELDQRLTPGGKGEAYTTRVDAIRSQWLQHVETLRAQVAVVVTDARDRSNRLLPARDGSLEAMFDRQARWARWSKWIESRPNIRASAILAEAENIEDVDALGDELPMYFRTAGADDRVSTTIAALVRQRLAQLAGPAAVAALRVADAAEVAAVRLEPMLDYLAAEIGGAQAVAPLHAALVGFTDAQAQSQRLLGQPLT